MCQVCEVKLYSITRLPVIVRVETGAFVLVTTKITAQTAQSDLWLRCPLTI